MTLLEIYTTLARQRTTLITKCGAAGMVITIDENMRGVFAHVQLDSGPVVQLNLEDFHMQQKDLEFLRSRLGEICPAAI